MDHGFRDLSVVEGVDELDETCGANPLVCRVREGSNAVDLRSMDGGILARAEPLETELVAAINPLTYENRIANSEGRENDVACPDMYYDCDSTALSGKTFDVLVHGVKDALLRVDINNLIESSLVNSLRSAIFGCM